MEKSCQKLQEINKLQLKSCRIYHEKKDNFNDKLLTKTRATKLSVSRAKRNAQPERPLVSANRKDTLGRYRESIYKILR